MRILEESAMTLRKALACLMLAFLIIATFSVGGKYIFELFGITLPAFRITGGILVFQIGLQMLQGELMTECKQWNPTSFMEISVPSQQAAELEQVSPQLAVAVGVAVATL